MEKGNCSHLSLVFYKVIDIIRHNYIHIFKGLQIKRHFCHQFWILRIKDTYILDNVKKAYVSHKIMLFGSCFLSFVNLGSNSLSTVQWTNLKILLSLKTIIKLLIMNTSLTKSLALSMLFKCFFNSWYVVSSNRIPNKMLAFFRSKFLLKTKKKKQ